MRVSVAMTTFNGAKYVREQLNSILPQLGDEDEIIICDDGSTDGTIEILEEYSYKDKRVFFYKNNRKGVVLNFEDAINKCENDIIFISDQDDIWLPEKINTAKEAFSDFNVSLILHNGVVFYEDNGNEEELIKNMKHGVISNILQSCYWGCCMAFRRELVKDILPFPKNVVAYDQWIGLISELHKKSKFIKKPLIRHRRHGKNVSKKLTLAGKIIFRINLAVRLIKHRIVNRNSKK